jgi:hypothetical protein
MTVRDMFYRAVSFTLEVDSAHAEWWASFVRGVTREALLTAAAKGRTEEVRTLLGVATPEVDLDAPLQAATKSGYADTAELLRQAKAGCFRRQSSTPSPT